MGFFFFKLFLHMFCKQQMFLYKSFMSLAISAAVSRTEHCISRSNRLKVVLKRPHCKPEDPYPCTRSPAWDTGRTGVGGAHLVFEMLGFFFFSCFGVKWWVGFPLLGASPPLPLSLQERGTL